MTKPVYPIKLYSKVAVISPDGTAALILRRSSSHPSKAGEWDIPGGYVNTDKGERAPTAARREAREEGNVSMGPVIVIGSTSRLDTDHHGKAYCIGALCAGQARSWDVRLSSEHDAYQWVTLQDAGLQAIKPKYRRLVTLALRFARDAH
jgi:8-oxo-dGTP pyrophosphatase MutT (NUDIX family)